MIYFLKVSAIFHATPTNPTSSILPRTEIKNTECLYISGVIISNIDDIFYAREKRKLMSDEWLNFI